MCNFGLLDTSDNVHLECTRFCFLPVINQDLDRVRAVWNTHRMRRNNRIACPAGKPEVLFFQPEIFGGRDYKIALHGINEIEEIEREYSQRPPEHGVSEEFMVIANEAIRHLKLRYPARDREEGT